ncbi:hypothetical protein NLJ89_g9090 [Agrocybe chaxingu]|uniref:Uncharacterized protein n=1 Tax=Agrocybe chaxingu TaxID=84603 RepID=A0A9W8JTE1_9AGAR|nr:hypothetical protein NLJ89_g9090 [Agrocybe chaxingu]
MQFFNMKNMALVALSIYAIPTLPSAFATPTDQGLAATTDLNVAREYVMTTAKYQLTTGETPSTTAVANSTAGSPSATSAASTRGALEYASAWPVGLLAAGCAAAVFL